MNLAACCGEADIVQYLLSKGADPHAADSDGWTPIWAAAHHGHADVVRLLVEAKADVNCVCTPQEWTPLHAAFNFLDTVRVLLECGADINKGSELSRTPLDCAIQGGYPETIRVLLGWASKPDLTTASALAALCEAAREGYTEVVSLVLEAGADVNVVDDENESLLSFAMRSGSDTLVRKILEYRPDVDITDENEDTALYRITRSTSVESVRLLANAGAKLNAINSGRSTPLMIAIREENEDVTRYLLGKPAVSATLNMASFRDRATPLHLACQYGSLETVRLLLELGSDPNFDCVEWHGTPLIAATLRSKDEPVGEDGEKQRIIQLLLKKGAVPAASAGDFGHPIISASLACSAEQLKLLLGGGGAPADVRDSFGRKPVHLACYNSLEVLRTLGVADSDFAARDVVGRVPLHYAVLSGQPGLVEEVVARSERVGVDINVKDNDGWTPLLWAARASAVETWNNERRHLTVISFMLRRGADTSTSARGLFRDWTAVEIAQYHHQDKYVDTHGATVSRGGLWPELEGTGYHEYVTDAQSLTPPP